MRGYIGFIVLIVVAIILLSRFVDLNSYVKNFTNGDYQEIDMETLISYSNFHDGNKVCTEGYHIKAQGFNVLKTNLQGGITTNAAKVEYESGKEAFLDSMFSYNKSAYIKACGLFESQRGLGQEELGVLNHKIIIEDYEVLENPTAYY